MEIIDLLKRIFFPNEIGMNNIDAFLQTIAVSEGTQPIGDRGYNCIVGSTPTHPILFTDYLDHPRKRIWLDKLGVYSTASGRYQIKADIYDSYKTRLNLPDFSPTSQDKIALQLIRECGAYNNIYNGQFSDAVMKCASRWASFPSSKFGQHEQTYATLLAAYNQAGGTLQTSVA